MPNDTDGWNIIVRSDTVTTDSIRLPATILEVSSSLEKSNERPIVVMVHGSGALDKDETVYANKPFRDLSEGLARRGISSLRYDKRTFVYHKRVSSVDEETIDDAVSAIKKSHGVSNRVFLIGHSLGAMLAPVIALRAKGMVAGIIMMAAPARDMEEVVREQIDYLLPSGASDNYKEERLKALRLQTPHYFIHYNQTDAARQLNIPILILQGERDYQVTMKDFSLWQSSLGDCKNARLVSYPDLNHLFFNGSGASSPMEYQNAGKVAECVIDDIADFILSAY